MWADITTCYYFLVYKFSLHLLYDFLFLDKTFTLMIHSTLYEYSILNIIRNIWLPITSLHM